MENKIKLFDLLDSLENELEIDEVGCSEEKEFQELKNKFPHHKDLQVLWEFHKVELFSLSKFHFENEEESKQILNDSEIVSARVCLSVRKMCGENIEKIKETWLDEFFKENRVWKFYERLCKIDINYGLKYLREIGMKEKELKITNVKFYTAHKKESSKNKLKSNNFKNVNDLHEKIGDYDFLEKQHDYIQKMFPNHYQSKFNPDSDPLSYLEVKKFKESNIIGLRILKSVCVFFDFLGLKLKPNSQWKIETSDEARLRKALVDHPHNQMRITRVIACLSITGFRKIALNLMEHLEEIGRNKKLKIKNEKCFCEWEKYSNKNKEKALELCFHGEEDFPYDHKILTRIEERMKIK